MKEEKKIKKEAENYVELKVSSSGVRTKVEVLLEFNLGSSVNEVVEVRPPDIKTFSDCRIKKTKRFSSGKLFEDRGG